MHKYAKGKIVHYYRMSKRVTRSMNANGLEDNRVEGVISSPIQRQSGPSRPPVQHTHLEVNIAEEMERCMRNALPGMLEHIQNATLKMVEARLKHKDPSENETHEDKESTKNESRSHEESNGEAHSNHKEVKKPDNKGCSYKSFTNTRPSIFEGKNGPLEAMNWLDEMESCFLTCHCAPSDMSQFASTMFKSNALHWWKSVRATRGLANTTSLSWDEFKGLMSERYFSPLQMRILESEFLRLEQGSMTVEKYVETFIEKSRFAEHQVDTEKRKVDRFVDGLRRDLRRLVGMSKPKTFQEAVELATLAEKDSYVPDVPNKKVKRKDTNVDLNECKKVRVSEEKISTSIGCATCGKPHHGECRYGKGVCFSCGKSGHMSKECKTKLTCYSCGVAGHRSTECPNKDLAQPKLLEGPNGKKPEIPKAKGRVFQMNAEEA